MRQSPPFKNTFIASIYKKNMSRCVKTFLLLINLSPYLKKLNIFILQYYYYYYVKCEILI